MHLQTMMDYMMEDTCMAWSHNNYVVSNYILIIQHCSTCYDVTCIQNKYLAEADT